MRAGKTTVLEGPFESLDRKRKWSRQKSRWNGGRDGLRDVTTSRGFESFSDEGPKGRTQSTRRIFYVLI